MAVVVSSQIALTITVLIARISGKVKLIDKDIALWFVQNVNDQFQKRQCSALFVGMM